MAAVAITGVGLHSAFGDLETTCAALEQERSAVTSYTLDQVEGFPALAGAAAATYELRDFLPDRKVRKFMNKVCELAVVAAGRALEHAGLLDDEERRADTALFVSTGLIAFDLSQIMHLRGDMTDEAGALDLEKMGRQGIRACHPLMPFKMLLNMPLGMVSIVYGLRGENVILYPGLDQAAICFDKALRGIGHGRFERALVGGSAQLLSLMPLSTLHRRARLAATPAQARPGPDHRGMAPTDAGAFVMLESVAAARARGANILGTIDQVVMARERADLIPAGSDEENVDRLFFTGSCSARSDGEEQAWQASLPQLQGAEARRFDHLLGQAGPAAIPLYLALACGLARCSQRAWIATSDPDGMHLLLQTNLGQEARA